MNNEQIERAIQFLLDNQAGYEVRLARLESLVTELTHIQKEMQSDLQLLRLEVREGVGQILHSNEQTMSAVRHLSEAETRHSWHISQLAERVERLESA